MVIKVTKLDVTITQIMILLIFAAACEVEYTMLSASHGKLSYISSPIEFIKQIVILTVEFTGQ